MGNDNGREEVVYSSQKEPKPWWMDCKGSQETQEAYKTATIYNYSYFTKSSDVLSKNA